jgi:hypothetical protein
LKHNSAINGNFPCYPSLYLEKFPFILVFKGKTWKILFSPYPFIPKKPDFPCIPLSSPKTWKKGRNTLPIIFMLQVFRGGFSFPIPPFLSPETMFFPYPASPPMARFYFRSPHFPSPETLPPCLPRILRRIDIDK